MYVLVRYIWVILRTVRHSCVLFIERLRIIRLLQKGLRSKQNRVLKFVGPSNSCDLKERAVSLDRTIVIEHDTFTPLICIILRAIRQSWFFFVKGLQIVRLLWKGARGCDSKMIETRDFWVWRLFERSNRWNRNGQKGRVASIDVVEWYFYSLSQSGCAATLGCRGMNRRRGYSMLRFTFSSEWHAIVEKFGALDRWKGAGVWFILRKRTRTKGKRETLTLSVSWETRRRPLMAVL